MQQKKPLEVFLPYPVMPGGNDPEPVVAQIKQD
jgi:hypothetical protein